MNVGLTHMKKAQKKDKYLELNLAYEDLFFGDYLSLLRKTPPKGKVPASKTPIKKEEAVKLLKSSKLKKDNGLNELKKGKKIFLDEIIHDDFYYLNNYYIKDKMFLYEDDDCIIFFGVSPVYGNSLIIEFMFKTQFNFDVDIDQLFDYCFNECALFYRKRSTNSEKNTNLTRFTTPFIRNERLVFTVHHPIMTFKKTFFKGTYSQYRDIVKLLGRHINEDFLNKLEL